MRARGGGSERPVVVVTWPNLVGGLLKGVERIADVVVREGPIRATVDELASLAAGADGVLCLGDDPITEEVAAAADRLKVVSCRSAGYDGIDVRALTASGIPLGNVSSALAETTADLTWALILAACRRVGEAQAAVRAGQWAAFQAEEFFGQDVHGATLGIVGYGSIGRAVARRGQGFSMRVIQHSRRRESEPGADWVDLDELCATADVITLHVPLSSATRHLIDTRRLALMKPTAVLVNVARGPVVDQTALAQALAARRIFAAGLDVTDIEPLSPDDSLASLPNCIVVPHIGSATRPARAAMAARAVENLLAGLEGRRLPECVNPEVYSGRTLITG